MSNYDDMRDMQLREQYGDDYVRPTIAFTGEDMAEMEHDHGEDAEWLMGEMMARDMARYDSEAAALRESRIRYLEQKLDEAGIDY